MTSISVSDADIRKWEAELAVHEKKAADLRADISAARQLMKIGGHNETTGATPQHPTSDNLMGTIAKLASEAPDPITKAELRARLKALGFPNKRLMSNYFYVAVKKLEERNKISILSDGSVWRP